jgi:hypothetical protein
MDEDPNPSTEIPPNAVGHKPAPNIVPPEVTKNQRVSRKHCGYPPDS